MNAESKKRAADYAKNYHTIKRDGFYGPVTVGNIGNHNGRDIINLCVKTEKSAPLNASISFPEEWDKASKFRTGDQVNIKVEGGYVKAIFAAKPMSVSKGASISAARTNDQAAEALEEKAAESAVEEALKEVEQTTPAATLVGETAPEDEPAF